MTSEQQIASVKPIKSQDAYPWLLEKHYAKRIPSISYAFGIFINSGLEGVVTYGTPSSSSLRSGIAGDKYINDVLELNRLCVSTNMENASSMLVSRSIKLLPNNNIIVSYADTKQGHVGYIYQATNFLYTGLSAKRTDWKIKGMEEKHGSTIADMSRGKENRAQYMRERFGDDFYLEERSRKHRYIYIHGDKRYKRDVMAALMYKIEDYPKGDTLRYDAGGSVETQLTFDI